MLYEFTFVVSGADAEDDSVVVALTEHLDATLARGAGVDLLVITAEGSDAIDAARNAVVAVRIRVPQIEFLHLDPDLVGISEIAERTGRSRQNVTQWVTGDRHNDVARPFPRPEGVVGRACMVVGGGQYLAPEQLGLSDELLIPDRGEMTDIDHMIRHNHLLTLNRPQSDFAWPGSMIIRHQRARLNWFVGYPKVDSGWRTQEVVTSIVGQTTASAIDENLGSTGNPLLMGVSR